MGAGTCSLLPRPNPSPQGPPGTAAQKTLSLGRAPAALTAAQVPCLPGAVSWLTRGTVGEPLGQAQGCGPLEVPLHGSGTACSRLPRPALYSLSAQNIEAGTAALAPGGPPAAPEGPGSAFSGGGARKTGGGCHLFWLLLWQEAEADGLGQELKGAAGAHWPMGCTHQTVVLLLQLQKGLLCRL